MKASLYTRPNKPFRTRRARVTAKPGICSKPLPKVVTVDKFTECHVTPSSVARRMVDYLDASPEQRTLEPSAGTGNLARALIDAGHNADALHMVERHIGLSNLLYDDAAFSGAHISNACFLEWSENPNNGKFDRVIINPPFKKVRQHIAAAESMLNAGGRIIALVPSTFKHDTAETLETLGPDTFALAKVHTKIIQIDI